MRALVTGAGGFLGGAVARALLKRGDSVVAYQRGDYPELARLGMTVVRGDLRDARALAEAAEGCQAFFHVAGKAGLWGPESDYVSANVTGTKNALAAARRAGIRKFIHTSSPSVVFGGRDLEGVDESAPIPESFPAHYPATKAEAERLVLAANGPEFAVTALRPHLIWGPGDNHLLPRLASRRKSGALRRVGEDKLVDTVYIDNAAEAHLLACDRLAPGAACAGKAYFISNDEPRPLWPMIDSLLDCAGLPPVEGRVPAWAAAAAGAAFETAYGALGIKSEPRMTRFLAKELSTAHWFDISAAKRDLGYAPKVSIDEGLRRLKAALGN